MLRCHVSSNPSCGVSTLHERNTPHHYSEFIHWGMTIPVPIRVSTIAVSRARGGSGGSISHCCNTLRRVSSALQKTVVRSQWPKLASHVGPLKIMCHINPVSYPLLWPKSRRVHPTFHDALLKPVTSSSLVPHIQPPPLSRMMVDSKSTLCVTFSPAGKTSRPVPVRLGGVRAGGEVMGTCL